MSVGKIIIVLCAALVAVFFYKRSGESREASAANVEAAIAFLAENRQKDGVVTTPSGLQFEILQPGTGTRKPVASDTVKVHYQGSLMNGTVFDSSIQRGEPIEFGLNRVISGWTEGLQLMTVGEKRRLFIPPELGYGNRRAGSIPPGSLLIFEVELLAINGEAG
ncbi:FKBP-type peptidyl-prolyl cis-trans isomerase [Spongiibacter taiwanensis]|uniref:FKBP-type peptidyl-prolyl cis-trans isomerase n=1 Tax=Spongiibacter taiwanensis TaxID=1748242 RepID=UPI0020362878|nr:FKBP-type peptidyl-prolyl cis-trans isomerase [Spongiibacter taiwanensis]USA42355.1 FKBP-type peptidyl-prolyl cis-trans isomerase [Spongiibacter taiwanensis]